MPASMIAAWLLGIVLLAAPATWASTALPFANESLLHSARLWESRERGDLALLALTKLVAARPDAPEALQELGELALRMGDIDAARNALDQLEKRFANSEPARTFAFEFQLATRDRLQLASLQRLVELKQFSRARTELASLFPAGAPQGYLALEYYRLLARLPGARASAIAGLKRLMAQRPDEPRYALALADLLNDEPQRRNETLRLLAALSKRDDIRQRDVDDVLIDVLEDAGADANNLALLQAYAQRHPDDRQARMLIAQIQVRLQKERRWQRQALAALQATATINPATNSAGLITGYRDVPARRKPRKTSTNLRRAGFAINSTGSTVDGRVNDMSDADMARLLQQHRANPQLDAALSAWHHFVFDASGNFSALTTPWSERALTALQAGNYAEATLHWQIATALSDADLTQSMQLAQALSERQHESWAGELLTATSEQHPQSAWAYATHVRWLINHGHADEALARLQQPPSDKTFTSADHHALLAAAYRARAADRNDQQAVQDLTTALALAPDDIWLRYQLAKLYASSGHADTGRALMQAAPAANTPTVRYAQALYLDHLNAPDEALATLNALPAAQWTDDLRNLHARLQRTVLQNEIEALINAHRDAEAAAKLDALLRQHPDDLALQRWRAELDLQLNNPQAARDRLTALVAQHPDNVSLRLTLVRALMASGEPDAARLQLAAAAHHAKPEDATTQLSIAWRAYSLDEFALAAASVTRVLTQHPEDGEALILAGRIAHAQHDDKLARNYYVRAEQSTHAGHRAEAHALRVALDEANSKIFMAGLIARNKPGDDGISRFTSLTVPTALRMPWHQGQLTLRADVVQLDAGTLPNNFAQAKNLGTVYAAGSNTPLRHLNTAQRGVALGAVLEGSAWQVDVGTTPLGFVAHNLVGGVTWRASLKQTDINFGIERRAVTSSVLSYAGMRDPVTGAVWGGVTSTGLTLQAGRYSETRSLSAALRIAQLGGSNVLSNQMITLRAAGNWRWLQHDQQELWLGGTVNVWRYQRNVQNYTWGQGGYYSPQSYLSVALPVEWLGMHGAWSYSLRASAALSHARTDSANYYPAHASLQAQAVQQAQLNNDGAPVNEAGSGGGISFSAHARLERVISAHLVLGTELSMDRADYYHPVEFSLYLRRSFGVAARAFIPPQPLRPYND